MNLKKWNWKAFIMIFLLSCVGASSNKNVNDMFSFLIVVGLIGVPIGLIFAFMSRED